MAPFDKSTFRLGAICLDTSGPATDRHTFYTLVFRLQPEPFIHSFLHQR